MYQGLLRRFVASGSCFCLAKSLLLSSKKNESKENSRFQAIDVISRARGFVSRFSRNDNDDGSLCGLIRDCHITLVASSGPTNAESDIFCHNKEVFIK